MGSRDQYFHYVQAGFRVGAYNDGLAVRLAAWCALINLPNPCHKWQLISFFLAANLEAVLALWIVLAGEDDALMVTSVSAEDSLHRTRHVRNAFVALLLCVDAHLA